MMNFKLAKFIGEQLRPVELALFTKWLLRIDREEFKYSESIRFYIDPVSHFGLQLQEFKTYEPAMTSEIKGLLSEGDTFIDLGANEGFFSIIASHLVGPRGAVILLEPQQRLWEVITKNIELNNILNCKLLPYAVDDHNSVATIHLYTSLNTGASSLSNGFNFKISFPALRKLFYGKSTIKTITLDELLTGCGLKKVKLVKIDIEGYEFQALLGGRKALQTKSVENLLIETHPEALLKLGQDEKMITDYLTSFGYNLNLITPSLFLYTANGN